MRLRAVIFDVDGTLVDSQGDILAAMQGAFEQAGRKMPSKRDILSKVGLSLDIIFPQLVPGVSEAETIQMVDWYKETYAALRRAKGSVVSSPLYPGARAALERLGAIDEVLLAVATGKSRRGLNSLIDGHGLHGVFLSQQVADDHPSKPNPSMILQVIREFGVETRDTVMIGDTSFDMQMARAAGVSFIGVSWGYHARSCLAGSDAVLDDFAQLDGALERIWSKLHG